jgi:hypothetical protein
VERDYQFPEVLEISKFSSMGDNYIEVEKEE